MKGLRELGGEMMETRMEWMERVEKIEREKRQGESELKRIKKKGERALLPNLLPWDQPTAPSLIAVS